MLDYRVVAGSVVRHKEGPASPVTVVLVAAMEHIGVEEEGVARLHLHFHQWQHLVCIT